MALDAETDWVVSSLLINAGTLARSKNVNWGAILSRLNIAPKLLTAPDNHVSLRQTLAALNDLGNQIGDPTFLINGFASLPIGAADLLDYLSIFAPDTKTAAYNWAHYAPLCSRGLKLTLNASQQGHLLTLTIPTRFGPNAQTTYSLMGLIASRLAYVLEENSRHVQIDIAALDPSSPDHSLKLGGFLGPITFETRDNRILVPYAVAEIPNPHADRNLLRLIETAANRFLAELGQNRSPLSKISSTIARGLREGCHSMEWVATSLGISQRSLQRLLEQEGTSYREVLEDVRRTSAESYLLDTRLPVKEIAYQLGFSNISAFSRAVKNWFGVAPRDLRKQAGTPPERELVDQSF